MLGRPSMKMPQRIRGYCPFCNKHVELEVERVKNRPRSELRAGQRRFRRGTAGGGGLPPPQPQGGRKATKKKPLRLRRPESKKAPQPAPLRPQKVQLGEGHQWSRSPPGRFSRAKARIGA